ncbi:MAG: hypothetical protein HXX09_00910 [Bacteroidetes bacterium]|nr:hypothetical protein [Bacteroidota bacterium]
MNINLLQWIGYAASITIALSMMMNSIVKFRWINMAGALTFSIYGFFINAIPVGILNGVIVVVDIYYLVIVYSKKEIFEILEIKSESEYLIRFIEFYNPEIQKFFPGFKYHHDLNTVSFFILRNMSIVGLFLAHREDDNVLKVGLDFVVPEYRDFKNGKFVYFRLRKNFIMDGFTKVKAESNNGKYIKYLKKLGFKVDENGLYSKDLELKINELIFNQE